PWQLRDRGRKAVVGAPPRDPVARTQRAQHLSRGGHQRHDAMRRCPGTAHALPRERACAEHRLRGAENHHDRDEDGEPYARRNRSHKNTGPPMTAVTMPPGSSRVAMMVRVPEP